MQEQGHLRHLLQRIQRDRECEAWWKLVLKLLEVTLQSHERDLEEKPLLVERMKGFHQGGKELSMLSKGPRSMLVLLSYMKNFLLISPKKERILLPRF